MELQERTSSATANTPAVKSRTELNNNLTNREFSMTSAPTIEHTERMERKVMEAAENLELTTHTYSCYVQIFRKRGEQYTWKAVLCTYCTRPALLHWKEEGECNEQDKMDSAVSNNYEYLVNNNRQVARDVRKIVMRLNIADEQRYKEWIRRNTTNDCIDSKPTQEDREVNSNYLKTSKLRENQCGQDINSFPGSKHQEKAENPMPQSTTKVSRQTSA